MLMRTMNAAGCAGELSRRDINGANRDSGVPGGLLDPNNNLLYVIAPKRVRLHSGMVRSINRAN